MLTTLQATALASRAAGRCTVCSPTAQAPVALQQASRPERCDRSSRRCAASIQAAATLKASPEATTADGEHDDVVDLTASPWQQTLNRSFCVGGVGLHTGEYAWVRVRPAFAGDGRYFVIVPKGTLSGAAAEADDTFTAEIDQEGPEYKEQQTEAFMQFLRAEQDGFVGSFEDYLVAVGLPGLAGVRPVSHSDDPEAAVPKGDDETVVAAHISEVVYVTPFTTVLGRDETAIASVETILAALEGLHVDNARIEIEGGHEVPVMDGSAQGWVRQIAKVGVKPAREEADGELVRKMSYRLGDTVSVVSGDAFVTLYPGIDYKLTCGLTSEAAAIGTQWRTFHTLNSADENFAFDVAPARTWLESPETAYCMKDLGYLRAGTVGCVSIADGAAWLKNADVRFLSDEPVRRNIIDLMGALSLMGANGNTGIPYGHIVAYKADQALLQNFVKTLYEEAGNEESPAQQVPFIITDEDIERVQAAGREAEAALAAEDADALSGEEEEEAGSEAPNL